MLCVSSLYQLCTTLKTHRHITQHARHRLTIIFSVDGGNSCLSSCLEKIYRLSSLLILTRLLSFFGRFSQYCCCRALSPGLGATGTQSMSMLKALSVSTIDDLTTCHDSNKRHSPAVFTSWAPSCKCCDHNSTRLPCAGQEYSPLCVFFTTSCLQRTNFTTYDVQQGIRKGTGRKDFYE